MILYVYCIRLKHIIIFYNNDKNIMYSGKFIIILCAYKLSVRLPYNNVLR